MKRLFIIFLAGVGLLVGGAYFMGSRLPREHEVTMTVAFSAPQDQAWAAITDVRAYPSWRGVKNVEILTPTPLTWKEDDMTLTVDAWQPPRRLVTRITDEGPFGGSWEYTIEPDTADAGKTRVTITESGFVNPAIMRFASKYLIGQTSSIDTYLRALSKKFGPEVAPTRVVVSDS
jgi:hypothetical protein